MSKAFIFDMDGVIVNSEPVWNKYGEERYSKFIGPGYFDKVKERLLGASLNQIYKMVKEDGSYLSEDEFVKIYDKFAKKVYNEAKITNNLERLIILLKQNDFRIGLVSSSRQNWIDMVLARLDFSDVFEIIISVNDRQDLREKPYPDGYIEAIEKLNSTPDQTIILEDSNSGIRAGKESGALVIALKENIVEGYVQTNADLYASNLDSLIHFINRF